ncbi:MAG: AAA family ATPase [Phycisphaerales bacterium]
MRIIAIVNQKGGCGKTTTAINLAGVFARLSKRTLLVDLDPQSHCAAGLAIPEQRIDVQIGDAMLARPEQTIDWTRLLWRVGRCLDLAPSTVRLAALESARGGLANTEGAETRLAGVLSRLADQYDICLVDCPPNIGLLTYNALAAASEVIVPVETAFFALQGAAKQINAIKSLSKRLNVQPTWRVLPTMHDPGSTLAKDVLDELNRRFGDAVLPVTIRFDHRLKEAVSFGQPVVDYAADAAGAQDYLALGQHLIGETGGKGKRFDALTRTQPAAPAGPSPVQVRAAAEFFSRSTPMASGAAAQPEIPTVTFDATPIAPSAAAVAAALQENVTTTIAEPKAASLSAEDVRTRLLELTSRVSRLADKARTESGTVTNITPLTLIPETAPQRKTTDPAATALLGVKLTTAGVLFVQPLSTGKQIFIAGDFNGWSATSLPMTRNDRLGVYERLVPIPPGRWQYRLVIDGHWTHDSCNPSTQGNPFGGLNSILDVPATSGTRL